MEWKEVGKTVAAIGAFIAIFIGICLIIVLIDNHYTKPRQAEELRNQWRAAMEAQPIDLMQALLLGDDLYDKLSKEEADKLLNEFLSQPYVQQMMKDYEAITKQEREFEHKYGVDESVVTIFLANDHINYDMISLETGTIPEFPEFKKTLKEMTK